MSSLIALIEHSYTKAVLFIGIITTISGGAIQYYKVTQEFDKLKKESEKIEQYKSLFTVELGRQSRELDSLKKVLQLQKKKDNIIISGLTAEMDKKYFKNEYIYDVKLTNSKLIYASNGGDKWFTLRENDELILYSLHYRQSEGMYGYYNFNHKWIWYE